MVRLTRLNHGEVVVNSDLIEYVESTPDTVITLTSSQKIMVLESIEEVIDRVIAYKRRIWEQTLPCQRLENRTKEDTDTVNGGNET